MARRCADLPLNRFSAGDPPPARWRCRRGWSGRPNHEMTPSGCSGSRPHRNHRLDRGPQHRATPFRARLQAPAAYGRTSGTRSSSPRLQRRRLPPIEDRLDKLRREHRQPQNPRDAARATWRRCAGQRDHAFRHLGAERRDARRPGLVTQEPVHPVAHEPRLPAPDAGLRLAGPPHDPGRPEAVGRRQNDASPPHVARGNDQSVTLTSTVMPISASDGPTKLPATGTACVMSRTTATGIRFAPPTLRFVGSKVIQPAPGT